MSRAHGDLVFTIFLSDWLSVVFHSARIVLLRFGDVIGCDEWAVPMVIWFSLCSFLIDFLVVFHSARIVLLRFGDVIGCDEWAVPMVIWFSLCSFLIDFLVVFHSARIVLLRFGDVIGCDEWAVPMVVCFLSCEIWRWCEIRFSCVPTVMSWVSRPCRELSLPPSTVWKGFHYHYFVSTIIYLCLVPIIPIWYRPYLQHFYPGSGISTCQDLEEIFLKWHARHSLIIRYFEEKS